MSIGSLHVEEADNLPITVVETTSFVADAKKLFTTKELEELKLVVALKPNAGDLIEGTGGV